MAKLRDKRLWLTRPPLISLDSIVYDGPEAFSGKGGPMPEKPLPAPGQPTAMPTRMSEVRTRPAHTDVVDENDGAHLPGKRASRGN